MQLGTLQPMAFKNIKVGFAVLLSVVSAIMSQLEAGVRGHFRRSWVVAVDSVAQLLPQPAAGIKKFNPAGPQFGV